MGSKFNEVAFNFEKCFKRSQVKYFGQSKNSKKCILKAKRSDLSWKVTFDVGTSFWICIWKSLIQHSSIVWKIYHFTIASTQKLIKRSVLGLICYLKPWRKQLLINKKIKMTPHVSAQNLPRKLGQQSAICWNSLGLFRDYGINHIFSTHSAYSNNPYFNFICPLSDWVEILWGFTKFFFKPMLKILVFYLEKQKKISII